jgi:hypothetical protein
MKFFCFFLPLFVFISNSCKKVNYEKKFRINYSVQNEYILPNEPALRFDVKFRNSDSFLEEQFNTNRFEYSFEALEGENVSLAAKAKQNQKIKASIIINGNLVASQSDSVVQLEIKIK